MPVSSYPRVTVQGTGTAQNTQNGQALMLVNPSTGKYEAATAATFGGGGGGGDATAANQSTQITEAQLTNINLNNILGQQAQYAEQVITNQLLFNNASAQGVGDLLYYATEDKSVATLLGEIKTLLEDIKVNQSNGAQITQIIGDGNLAHVTTANELVTKNNA